MGKRFFVKLSEDGHRLVPGYLVAGTKFPSDGKFLEVGKFGNRKFPVKYFVKFYPNGRLVPGSLIQSDRKPVGPYKDVAKIVYGRGNAGTLADIFSIAAGSTDFTNSTLPFVADYTGSDIPALISVANVQHNSSPDTTTADVTIHLPTDLFTWAAGDTKKGIELSYLLPWTVRNGLAVTMLNGYPDITVSVEYNRMCFNFSAVPPAPDETIVIGSDTFAVLKFKVTFESEQPAFDMDPYL